MFADTEAKLVKLWEQKILGGLSLRVEYDTIKNDLTNKNVNYSFMANQCNKAFMDKDQLVQAVVRGEGAFKHYANMMDGRIEWNKTALRAWLQDYAEIQHLLLLWTGAPSHGMELTILTYHNTMTCPTCSLVMLDKHLTILCQYMKTTALTGHDKLILHAFTSDILIQDLACQTICRDCSKSMFSQQAQSQRAVLQPALYQL